VSEKRTPQRVTAERVGEIAATDYASLVKRRDSRDVTGRSPAIPKKVRAAVELLTTTPDLDYAAIAKAVGYPNAYALRRALALPQAVKFLREFKRQLVEEISMGNPAALREIRDNSENSMAKVQAIRTLETMSERMDGTGPGRFAQQTPGVTIVIETAPGVPARVIGPQPPLIDAQPDEFGPATLTNPRQPAV
jgi:hypothetical protein